MNTESKASRSESSQPIRQFRGRCPRHQLTAPASQEPALRINEILVPMDFSEHSNYALRYAMPFARQFNARITLLHVLEPPSIPADGAYVGVDSHQIAMNAEHAIARIWEQEKSKQPQTWRSIVKEGIPDQVIIQTARDLKTDLVIIATHGRTGLARVFLGSTTERVIRQAPCPILVVRLRPTE